MTATHIHLRTARKLAGLTQSELAKRAGVDQATVSRLEADPDAKPEYTTHLELAKALSVRPEFLRYGPDPQPMPAPDPLPRGERRKGRERRKGGRRRANRLTAPDRRKKDPRRG